MIFAIAYCSRWQVVSLKTIFCFFVLICHILTVFWIVGLEWPWIQITQKTYSRLSNIVSHKFDFTAHGLLRDNLPAWALFLYTYNQFQHVFDTFSKLFLLKWFFRSSRRRLDLSRSSRSCKRWDFRAQLANLALRSLHTFK